MKYKELLNLAEEKSVDAIKLEIALASLKQEIMEVVAISFETGHFSFKDFDDFKREYPDFSKEGWEYYVELINMGPIGFYEEFKDKYDFDSMFVEEYGHYYDN